MTLIFINPGHSFHGQPDPGACYNGHRECDVADIIGNALATALKKYENVQIQVYQQYNDSGLVPAAKFGNKNAQLNAVSKKANIVKANYFVSIHLNANVNTSAKGVEVLYNPSSTWGKIMAQKVQEQLIKPFVSYTLTDRKIKERKDLAVLNQTNMPAILIEVGFISNAAELQFILENADVIAERIATGLANAVNLKARQSIESETPVQAPSFAEYKLEPSNGKYNLYKDGKLVLKENKYETVVAYMNVDVHKAGIIA